MARGTEFPKFVYHKVHGERVVVSQQDHDSLGEGWGETPHQTVTQPTQDGGVGPIAERLDLLESRVGVLEALFTKLRTRKDIDKLLAEKEETE